MNLTERAEPLVRNLYKTHTKRYFYSPQGTAAMALIASTINVKLADPTRRDILRRVAQRECTVTELAQPFDMSLAAVSKHIKVLERASLLRQTRAGRIHRCQFNPAPLKDAAELIAYLERFWGERLASLEQFLKEQTELPTTQRNPKKGKR